MQRVLELSKFRNLGFDKPDTLVINNSIEKGELGGVVTLIGQNNAGKSNVLKALVKFGNGGIDEKDITSLSYNRNDRIPSLSLVYKEKDEFIKFTRAYGSKLTWEHNVGSMPEPSLTKIKEEITDLFKELSPEWKEVYPDLEENYKAILKSDTTKDVAIQHVYSIYDKLSLNVNRNVRYYRSYVDPKVAKINSSFNSIKGNYEIFAYVEFIKSPDDRKEAAICNRYLSKFGLNGDVKIVEYAEKNISENELCLDNIADIDNSEFFKSLFKILNIDIEEIKTAYKEYAEHTNIQILKKVEKKISKKMDLINNRFNSLYFAEKDEYKFGVTLESSKIHFSMARGEEEDPIMLNAQSTGFRWFFDLYFNFLAKNTLSYGDIVVIDEIGSVLHPQGVVELRKFLSEFGKKNGITFVVATHNPFFIDRDCLDEIRVVSLKQNKAYIDNLFTAVNNSDPDSLLPIKDSLTIKQNVLYDYETEVVWVEGITDYCYLTMFKNILGYKNISFLPFNGVGNTKDFTSHVLKRIIGIKMYKRSILVDSDKAGMDMFEQCKGTAFDKCRHHIAELSDEKHKFMMIEDLFSKEDKDKYSSLNSRTDKYKKACLASVMKSKCELNDFSKITIDNFKKLFELILG